ncbi:MAG: flagellar FlbD family protein [Thermoanaerobacteraceae bacterium]|nr:flagellar FlbD family protein [Thermoanaerobacteraceae bacterium]
MIRLTRLNGIEFVLNAEMIEYMESTPDTVITLTNGHKHIVLEPIDEVINRVINYKQRIYKGIDCENK